MDKARKTVWRIGFVLAFVGIGCVGGLGLSTVFSPGVWKVVGGGVIDSFLAVALLGLLLLWISRPKNSGHVGGRTDFANDEEWRRWFATGMKDELPTSVLLAILPAAAVIRYAWIAKNFGGGAFTRWALVVLLVAGVLNLANNVWLLLRFRKGMRSDG